MSASFDLYSSKYDSEHYAQGNNVDDMTVGTDYLFLVGNGDPPDSFKDQPFKRLNVDPGESYSSVSLSLKVTKMSTVKAWIYGPGNSELDDKTLISVVGETESYQFPEHWVYTGGYVKVHQEV